MDATLVYDLMVTPKLPIAIIAFETKQMHTETQAEINQSGKRTKQVGVELGQAHNKLNLP